MVTTVGLPPLHEFGNHLAADLLDRVYVFLTGIFTVILEDHVRCDELDEVRELPHDCQGLRLGGLLDNVAQEEKHAIVDLRGPKLTVEALEDQALQRQKVTFQLLELGDILGYILRS